MTLLVEEKVSPAICCNNNTKNEAVLSVILYVDSDFWLSLYIMGPLFFVMDFLRICDNIRFVLQGQHENCPIIAIAHLPCPIKL
jgi:hypothetical protein